MNWFISILLAFISTNATKYQVLVEYATAEKDEFVYGYVKVYGYADKEKTETTKTIDSNDNFDEWDETFDFDEDSDNYGKYDSFQFKLYDEKDECLGETDKISITEIKECDEWFAMQLTVVLDNKEFGTIFVGISKDCDNNNDDDPVAEVLIIPNDILNPSDPHFPNQKYLGNVYGRLTLTSEGDKTRIKGKIYGLMKETYHGFHVHDLGDLTEGCYSTSLHYNPFDKLHGGPDSDIRHAGDLGNIWGDEDGIAEIDITDELVQLTGQNNVIGRAIVIHMGSDNLKTDPTGDAGGRPACGLIGIVDDYKVDDKEYYSGKGGNEKGDNGSDKDEDSSDSSDSGSESHSSEEGYDEEVIRATSVLLPNENELFDCKTGDYSYKDDDDDMVRGFLNIEVKGDEVTIIGEIEGLEPNSKYGFHIHEFGNITESCLSTGGHFNPYDEKHGGPDDKERHVGDLGNIEANDKGVAFIDITDSMVTLNGDTSVIGRAFVVHEKEDDLKTDPTGDAGDRLACGVIGIAEVDDEKKY